MVLIKCVLLIVGFLLLVKGADWFIDGCSSIATRFSVPQIVIGLTIVAMGTSVPEAAVSINAAFKGAEDIAVGNVIGSNILNIFIILGITSVIIPIVVGRTTLKYEIPFMIIITILLVIMGINDNVISKVEGCILLIIFFLYLKYLFLLAKNGLEINTPIKENRDNIWKIILMNIVLGLIAVVAGSYISVDAAKDIAEYIGISERVIGLTIVALGTSLPELVTSYIAAKKGNADIAIGNILGSNIFNILFVIGVSAVVTPLVYEKQFIIDGGVAVLAGILLFILAFKNKRLGRIGGIIFLSCYVIYLTYLCMGTIS